MQIFTFVMVFTYPSKMDNQLSIFLSKKVSIKINKNHPSYVAYDAVNIKRKLVTTFSQNLEKDNLRVIQLSTEGQDEIMNHFHPLSKKLVLNAITIKKEIQVISAQYPESAKSSLKAAADITETGYRSSLIDQKNWVAEFKPYFRKKIQNNETDVSWDRAGQSKQTAARTTANVIGNGPQKSLPPAAINTKEEKSKYTAESQQIGDLGGSLNRIVGEVEVRGLPYTNDHHIEIRRFEEGVFREKGTADLLEYTYEIFPTDLKGFLLGRLVDNAGKILGEGVVRISDTVLSKTGAHRGPKILIMPTADVRGHAVSSYNIGNKTSLPEGGKAAIFQGQNEKPVAKDGLVTFDNVVRNSATTLTVESKGHFTSQQTIISGENFSTELIPEKMGVALKQIVSDLRQQNLNDPNLSIVLGKVTFDGRPVSGVSVKAENTKDLEAVYFNALMIPDVKLTTTSENGYYALIVEGGDMMTLMAYRGDKYFGHVNTTVSPGMTSFAEIQNTVKSENVDIKVYDPFTGLPETANLEIQGQSESIAVENGLASAQLPSLARWSFLFSSPTEKYLPAHYTYIEKSDYIYVPVVSRDWMNYVFSSGKLNLYPATNIVIGFVVDEDFEVELANQVSLKNNIVYFDYTGKVVDHGTQGGGFILYNLPEGIYEPLVFGTKSQKVYSRIAPLKSSDIFIFTYKLDGAI